MKSSQTFLFAGLFSFPTPFHCCTDSNSIFRKNHRYLGNPTSQRTISESGNALHRVLCEGLDDRLPSCFLLLFFRSVISLRDLVGPTSSSLMPFSRQPRKDATYHPGLSPCFSFSFFPGVLFLTLRELQRKTHQRHQPTRDACSGE